MRLAAYLSVHGITPQDFAETINVSHRAVVHRYANGDRIPHPDIMARIVDATNGQVQPNDFYSAAAE